MKMQNSWIFLLIILLVTSCSPSPETFATQTAEAWTTTPESTITSEPTQKILKVKFTYPVDLTKAPMYGAYDLDLKMSVIQSNAGEKYNMPISCKGNWMHPGTNDNHPGYDFGSGMCGEDISGTKVYGMSIEFNGIVTYVESGRLLIDYGSLILTDSSVGQVTIQYGHLTPNVEINQLVNSETVVGELNEIQEVEIKVLINNVPSNPMLIGLEPMLSEGPMKE